MTQDPFVGMTLGSYKVTEPIGEGGMARIYKGYHVELKRYAAIKVINWGLQEDPEFTERFRREAQAIASLRHPNIVQIFDFGKHERGYFMVMEFIDGYDLSVELRRAKESGELLPKAKILQIIKDTAAALDYAHSREVIHRDVKPSNIMIQYEGQAILTDFGLVMLPAHRSQITLGSTFGTPHYVAPEQAISSAAAVSASDIYSLGVILYEMVTGQLPFDDESPLSVALKHISNLPTSPRALNPDLSPAVEEVILKSLAKQPVDRFTSAGELAASLEAAWSNYAPAPAGKTFSPVLPAGVPPVADVANITLPNAAAVAPVSSTSPSAADVDRQPSARRATFRWWPWAVTATVAALLLPAYFFFFTNLSADSDATPAPSSPAAIGAISTEIPTTTPTSTASPTFTPVPPSATPAPTSTSTPAPTETPLPVATSTLTPTPSPIPTITAAATSTPVALLPTPVPTAGPLTAQQLRNKILFKTDRSGTVEIYQMNADGSDQRPLPRENWSIYTELEAALPYSPDKTQLIVTRGAGQLDLWWANLTAGTELRITSTGQPEYDAAWSPIDNRIAYVSEETGNGDIYILNLDGSAVIRLTDNVDVFDKHPTWSPDGTQIAFWSDRSFNKSRQIWVVDVNTKNVTSLSDNPFNDWDPVWVW